MVLFFLCRKEKKPNKKREKRIKNNAGACPDVVFGFRSNKDTIVLSAPFSFVRGGRYIYDNGDLSTRGNAGRYWESLAFSTAYSRRFYFNSASFTPQNGDYRGYGFSLRCVAKKYKDTIVLSAPFSFVREGYYDYNNGGLGSQGRLGRYFESLAYSTANSRYFVFNQTIFEPKGGANKGSGYSLRCVGDVALLF